MDAQAAGVPCARFEGTTAGAAGGFLRFFVDLPDPRAANVVHRLGDILLIAVCAVICGADSWVDVQTFAQAKLPWLSTFLDLSGGIPSHDTFGRVFAALDPDAFERCFGQWMASLRSAGMRLIAIDGKSIRRSFDHAWDASGMAHLVSAFAAQNALTFAQVATAGKGQELEAMRRLIDLLALDETNVVTIDALGCQRDIAQRIIAKEADYLLAVKENQPALYGAVKRVLDEANHLITDNEKTHHERYLELYRMISERDDTIALAFNNPQRSTAFVQLLAMYTRKMLTDEELAGFKLETLERLRLVLK